MFEVSWKDFAQFGVSENTSKQKTHSSHPERCFSLKKKKKKHPQDVRNVLQCGFFFKSVNPD